MREGKEEMEKMRGKEDCQARSEKCGLCVAPTRRETLGGSLQGSREHRLAAQSPLRSSFLPFVLCVIALRRTERTPFSSSLMHNVPACDARSRVAAGVALSLLHVHCSAHPSLCRWCARPALPAAAKCAILGELGDTYVSDNAALPTVPSVIRGSLLVRADLALPYGAA